MRGVVRPLDDCDGIPRCTHPWPRGPDSRARAKLPTGDSPRGWGSASEHREHARLLATEYKVQPLLMPLDSRSCWRTCSIFMSTVNLSAPSRCRHLQTCLDVLGLLGHMRPPFCFPGLSHLPGFQPGFRHVSQELPRSRQGPLGSEGHVEFTEERRPTCILWAPYFHTF